MKYYTPRTAETRKMYELAGWRERYAMENGNRTDYTENGHKLTKYTYSTKSEYQDANGATFDHTRGAWIA